MPKKKKAFPTFVVKSAIKEYAKKKGLMVGSDSYDAINAAIGAMLSNAFDKAGNPRKTLEAHDL